MLMFLSGDNIEIIIYLLGGLTIILIILMVYIHFSNNRKMNIKSKKMNMIDYNIEDDLSSVEKEGVSVHLEEKKLISNTLNKKGVSVHLDKKELKKMHNFKISSITLFKANITKNNNIVNGDLKGKSNLLNAYDFYFSIHKFLNKLFTDEIFLIGKDDLFKLHNVLSKMNLGLFRKTIQQVSEKNNLLKAGDKDLDLLFKKILIGAIDNENYLILKEDNKKYFQEKIESIKKVLRKQLDEQLLTKEDNELLELYSIEKEINEEIQKVFGRKNGISLLSFDVLKKEMHITIDYNNILDKKLGALVTYYKEKNNLNNIIFYI